MAFSPELRRCHGITYDTRIGLPRRQASTFEVCVQFLSGRIIPELSTKMSHPSINRHIVKSISTQKGIKQLKLGLILLMLKLMKIQAT